MVRNLKVVFENMVFSKPDEIVPSDLYLYDPDETRARNARIKTLQNGPAELEFAREIIINEYYPDWTEYWAEREEEFDEFGEPITPMNQFCIEGGRRVLITLIEDNHYEKAIPELRKIALSDPSSRLRRMAIYATRYMKRDRADKMVNEVFKYQTDPGVVMDIAMYIALYSYGEIYVRTLREKFEEFYYDYEENWLTLKWFHTVPQAIVQTCSRIHTLESLALLEDAFRHPYVHIENNARISLYQWSEGVMRSKRQDPKLTKKAIEIIKKYDLGGTGYQRRSIFTKQTPTAYYGY